MKILFRILPMIDGKVTIGKNSFYSLENNLTVVQISEAAREAAKTGKTVILER